MNDNGSSLLFVRIRQLEVAFTPFEENSRLTFKSL